jgi:hypothetical protein
MSEDNDNKKENSIFKGDYDLFNNPMVTNARNAMSQKDLDRYKDWGEAVFDDIDYETASVTQYPPPMINALLYIENSLRSGQHPSTLTKDEINILNEMIGEKWYEKWGYVKEDLEDIVTVLKM